MKKIIILLICFILLFGLFSCTQKDESKDSLIDESRFVLVDEYRAKSNSTSQAAYVLADRETGVCYLLVVESQGSGLTIMVDSEGKPLIWEGFDE